MKKFISTIAGALMMFAMSAPLATIAKSAEFFTIGTGGPTEKKVLAKLTDVPRHLLEVQTIILDKSKKVNSNLV